MSIITLLICILSQYNNLYTLQKVGGDNDYAKKNSFLRH
jgi:hypothetical protein